MLTLNNIDKSFLVGTPDENKLFSNFSFELREGDFVSVVGSNGSGKTTLLNLVCGSLMPDSGTIVLKGLDITKLPEYVRARRIGRVFQDPKAGTCSSLSILENMALADNKNKRYSLTPCINKSKIDYYKELVSKCKMGLEDRMGTLVGSLSGGQRQALALVIADMSDIDLLILDEHTAALDPNSSETIMSLTKKIIEDKKITTLMVTHNLRYAVEYGNRIVMMHSGSVILDKRDDEKAELTVDNLLHIFNKISIECGN